MLKISKTDKRFSRLATPTLKAASILECRDLQSYIFNSPDAFCNELGEDLKIIGKEVRPAVAVDDRIDLLAVDSEGYTVIIELKRGKDKLQLLQAIAYAGMISKWTSEDVLKEAGSDSGLEDFVEDSEIINQRQRILLIAEEYDYEVLVGAEWLYEKSDVAIACVRVALAVDDATGAEYMTFTQVFPTPELDEIARSRKRAASDKSEQPDAPWDAALAKVTNPAVVGFFERQRAAGMETLSHHRLRLFVGPNNHCQIRVGLRKDSALVTQRRHFAGDKKFWQERPSQPESIHSLTRGWLRFRLRTAEDFSAFEKFVSSESNDLNWGDADDDSASVDAVAG